MMILENLNSNNMRRKRSKKEIAPRTRNGNTWTEAEYFNKIRYSLRSAFRFWIPMMRALKKAERKSQSKTNLRLKYEYQCAECKRWFPRKGVQIDHIIPCGELRSYEDIAPFIRNLTQENSDSYQVLCKKHHLVKTKKERDERKFKRENTKK